MGVAAGLGLAGVVDQLTAGQMLGPEGPLFLLGAAVLMAVVGTLAAWRPARRGPRIQPTEALRPD